MDRTEGHACSGLVRMSAPDTCHFRLLAHCWLLFGITAHVASASCLMQTSTAAQQNAINKEAGQTRETDIESHKGEYDNLVKEVSAAWCRRAGRCVNEWQTSIEVAVGDNMQHVSVTVHMCHVRIAMLLSFLINLKMHACGHLL